MYSSPSHNTAIIIREQEPDIIIVLVSHSIRSMLSNSWPFIVDGFAAILLFTHTHTHTHTTFNYTSKALKHFYNFFYYRLGSLTVHSLSTDCVLFARFVWCVKNNTARWRIAYIHHHWKGRTQPNQGKSAAGKKKKRKNNKNIRRSSSGRTMVWGVKGVVEPG